MSGDDKDAAQFMEALIAQWREQAANATSMLRGQHKKMATTYRDFLDKQIVDAGSNERQWARTVQEMLIESMKSQREMRAKFLDSQRSMVDNYIEMLDKMEAGSTKPDGDSPSAKESAKGE